MGTSAPAPLSDFAREVRAGLTRPDRKTLPCSYLYDEAGSALFQAITALPEYGLARADARLVREHAAEAIAKLPSPLQVVELGSGDGSKTRSILEALAARERARYFPIDMSAAALASCRRELSPVAEVTAIEDTYLEGLRRGAAARPADAALLVLFLGSTIGNFDREEASAFLGQVRAQLRPGDALLLGTDLIKPVRRMLAAYDDPAGVTAAFNRNLLARVNRELGADFALRSFAHRARWDAGARRIEMHLVCRASRVVHIPGARIVLEVRRGETIWTESSHKFEPGEAAAMAARAGFSREAEWVDAGWPFAETLLRAV